MINRMKTLFALLACILLADFAYAQKVTLNCKGEPLSEVMAKIESQTGYVFNYTQPPVNPSAPVTISVENADLEKVLESIFKGMDLKVVVANRKVYVSKAAQQPQSQPLPQKVEYTGTVVDGEGLPVIGAGVLVKGTTYGVTTDFDGKFTIETAEGTTLIVSSLGYSEATVTTGAQKNLHVVLTEEKTVLEDAVVVGYTTRSREKLISSVSTINGNELVKSDVPNLENALSGKVSGVFSRQTSGEPGRDDANLTIRGFGSALVVVDGIPGRSYSDIDPNEIESISVLKDASAAAVYGMQGANGVILVTTKRGSAATPLSVNATAKYSLQQAVNFPHSADSELYNTLLKEYDINRRIVSDRSAVMSNTSSSGDAPLYNTDWYREMIRLAPSVQANLNVAGGSEQVNYFVSGGYLHQEGIWSTNSTAKNRFNVRSNIDANLAKGLKLSLGMGAVITRSNYPYNYSKYISQQTKNAVSTIPVKWHDDDPYYAFNGEGSRNPMAMADPDACGYNKSEGNDFTIDAALEYKLPWVDGLSVKANLSYTYANTYGRIWMVDECYIGYRQDSDEYYNSKSVDYTDKADLTVSSANNGSLMFQGFLNYKKSIENRHNINAGLVYELNSATNKYFFSKRTSYPSTVTDRLYAGLSGANLEDGETFRTYHSVSIVERFSYDYCSRYFVDINSRLDGAQYFARKWGFFPSASIGWMLTNEPFMEGHTNVLKEFKLRASYGVLGDLANAKAYYDANEMYYYQAGYKYPGNEMKFGDRTLLSLEQTVIANPDFTWSTSSIVNVGIDFKLFKDNLLTGSFDIFRRQRNGLPALKANDNAGSLATYYNLNSDNTRGFELSLNHSNRVGEFQYNASLNLSWSRTKWDHYEQASFNSGYDQWSNALSGRWTNTRLGYHVIGRYESFEDIASAPYHSMTNGNDCILPGDYKYEDVNGDGYIDHKDMMPIGRTAYPELMYGLNLSLSWKNLDFAAFFQGAALCQFTVPEYDLAAFSNGNTQLNCWEFFGDRWHKADYANPNSEWVPGMFPAIRDWADDSINKYANDANMFNGAYLRLKNIELGYTLKRAHIRFFAASYNLFTISAQKYFDPETCSDEAYTFASYPQIRTFVIGANLKF